MSLDLEMDNVSDKINSLHNFFALFDHMEVSLGRFRGER